MTKIKHKELLRRLSRTAKAITEHIHEPNYGGCGVIAALVGQEISDLGFMVEVVTPVGNWYGRPAAEVRANIVNPARARDWDENGLSRSHLAVRFRSSGRTYTWDSDGLRRGGARFGRDGRYQTSTSFGDGLHINEAKVMSARQAGWNRQFVRKQIPLLRHLVVHHMRYGL